MSTSEGGGNPLDRLRSVQDAASNPVKIEDVLLTAFITPIVEFLLQVARTIDALFSIIVVPTRIFIDGIGAFILSVVGGAARIVSAGAASTAQSLLVGVWSALGPLNYAVAISSVMVGVWIIARTAREQGTSDSLIGFFSGTDLPDLPIIGRFGVEEEDEEGAE